VHGTTLSQHAVLRHPDHDEAAWSGLNDERPQPGRHGSVDAAGRGFAAQDRADRVIGIDASGTPEQTRAQVRHIVDSAAELVELGRAVRDDEIIIIEDYAYPAYGVPSEDTNAAIRLAARTEALITDPVYEGKSMQGLIDLTKTGFFPKGSKVLYAHLGGAPALNGYSYYYREG